MSDFSLLCGFKLIYGDEEILPKEQYLHGVDKGTLLKFASYLLGLDPSISKLNKWTALVNMWFRPANEDMYNTVWARCVELEKKYGNISLLSIVASLKLFEFVFEANPQYVEADELTSERNLFKLYLIFVDEVTSHEEDSREYLAQLEGTLRIASTLLNQTYPYADLQNYSLQDIFLCQLIKAYYLFEFLKGHEDTEALLNEFCKVFGIANITEYFQHFSLIYKGHLDHPSEGWVQFDIPKDDQYKKNIKFLDAISLTDFDPELDADFKLLRGNPIYKTAEGKYSIISPLFTTEKIYKGLYFKLNEINASLPDASRVKNFRSFYTTHFSENFLLYRVLEYIYSGRSYKQFSGSEMAEIHDGASDYYIRNGNYLFLFENKDIFINADVKQGGNFIHLEKEFEKKLYFEQKANGTTVYKGVCQLAENVKRALLNQNGFDKDYKAKNLNIYPILVLHDSSFNAPGFNYLINHWFQIELSKLEAEGINISKVRPVTVMFIDTLILYADYLKVKKLPLDELIDEYRKHSTFNFKKKYKSEDHVKSAWADALWPFSLFVNKFTKNEYIRVPFKLRDSILPEIFKS